MSPYAVDPYVADFAAALLLTLAAIGVVGVVLPVVAAHARRLPRGPHRRGLDALARITKDGRHG